MKIRQVIVLAVALVLAARAAQADGFVSPFIGVNFGGDAGTTLSDAVKDSSKVNVGVAIGYMGGGVFGIEEDIAYSPNFFGNGGPIDSSNVVTAMSNLIVGLPFGGQRGAGFRPYVSGGVGLLRQRVDTIGSLVSFSAGNFGYDVGGGFMGYFSDHVGLRGDLRYFRNFAKTDDNAFGITPGPFNFSRASAGLLVRF